MEGQSFEQKGRESEFNSCPSSSAETTIASKVSQYNQINLKYYMPKIARNLKFENYNSLYRCVTFEEEAFRNGH